MLPRWIDHDGLKRTTKRTLAARMAIGTIWITLLALTYHLVGIVVAYPLARPYASGDDTASSSRTCCSMLKWWLGEHQVMSPQTEAYTNSRDSYWSQQEAQLSPSCIVRPRNTQEVATAVWLLGTMSRYRWYLGGGQSQCKFAIRGGGHTPFSGSANINDGVTIDLSRMKEVLVRSDRMITEVGPGTKWLDVYMKLDEMGLAVSGGRVSDVGVAGLTTGGGVSFFAPRYGLVCDNVENFEVVLASGEIVNANARENSDLWFALKGGSNNFGVVTRFDLKTFEQGPFWGGFIGYPIEARHQQFQAFEQFNSAAKHDPYATLINNYAYNHQEGWMITNSFEYTRPEPYPEVFRPFTDYTGSTFNSMRISNLSDFAIELNGQNSGYARRLFATLTIRNSASLLEEIHDLSNATLQTILPCEDITWALTYQAVPVSISATSAAIAMGDVVPNNNFNERQENNNTTTTLSKRDSSAQENNEETERKGSGNALGLNPHDGPLIIVLLSVFWRSHEDDSRLEEAIKTMFDQAHDLAIKRGMSNDWVYLNYAAPWQDPIKGYGEANREKLREVSRRYDPRGVFQEMCPGGFKLWR